MVVNVNAKTWKGGGHLLYEQAYLLAGKKSTVELEPMASENLREHIFPCTGEYIPPPEVIAEVLVHCQRSFY